MALTRENVRARRQYFKKKAKEFADKTSKYTHQGINPGGYYHAVWSRDASYILKDWFLSGELDKVLQEIDNIWSNQIEPGKQKIVYGRGSPELNYLSQVADSEFKEKFEGALPTIIFPGRHSEIFGKHPDIDSTALMISTTSWIFDAYLDDDDDSLASTKLDRAKSKSVRDSKTSKKKSIRDPSELIDSTIPRMLKAIEYLRSRDTDHDGLLEQDHNEDWMDSVLRSGKIVYTQASWLMALTNFFLLLSHIGMEKQASTMRRLAEKNVSAVEKQLWSDEEGCYLDKQESHHLGKSYKTLTQDVSLYLVATTERTARDMLSRYFCDSNKKRNSETLPDIRAPVNEETLAYRAASTLDVIKSRTWQKKWPLVSEVELEKSGPWDLNPNVYHNHTFWPWSTGIEMLARSRYQRYDECNELLSFMTGHDRNGDFLALCEWVNPITEKRGGAFPFRTGICATRIAITDILMHLEDKNKPKGTRRRKGPITHAEAFRSW